VVRAISQENQKVLEREPHDMLVTNPAFEPDHKPKNDQIRMTNEESMTPGPNDETKANASASLGIGASAFVITTDAQIPYVIDFY
jgi:hypothetical protein